MLFFILGLSLHSSIKQRNNGKPSQSKLKYIGAIPQYALAWQITVTTVTLKEKSLTGLGPDPA